MQFTCITYMKLHNFY